MEQIKIFNSDEFGSVRTIIIDGEPWFAGKDVAASLGYKDTSDALKKHVAEDDKLTTLGNIRNSSIDQEERNLCNG